MAKRQKQQPEIEGRVAFEDPRSEFGAPSPDAGFPATGFCKEEEATQADLSDEVNVEFRGTMDRFWDRVEAVIDRFQEGIKKKHELIQAMQETKNDIGIVQQQVDTVGSARRQALELALRNFEAANDQELTASSEDEADHGDEPGVEGETEVQ